MNLISVDGISKRIGDRTLFHDFSFGLDQGDRVGLIGVNGSGKSTLLRLLTGSELPDSGQVTVRRGVRRALLKQTPEADPEQTVLEHVFSGDNPLTKLLGRYELACAREAAGQGDRALLDSLSEQLDESGAWEYEHSIKAMLHRLGIENLESKMGTMSGGMLKKTSLAQVLIDQPDVLFLDEPTNHLDIETVAWLEEELTRSRSTVVLVTHDRYFLENVVNRIFEIEDGEVRRYPGNYSVYLERKAEEDEQKRRISQKAKSILRGELEWLSRQPQARGTKSKSRIERVGEIQKRVLTFDKENFEFSATGRSLGKKVLSVQNADAMRGDRLIFSDFTHHFKRGERIGVVGPNGAGKTTLLDLLAGNLEPSAGKVSPGVNTQVAIFTQTDRELPKDRRVLQFVKESIGHTATFGKENVRVETSQLLEMFRLNPALQVGQLSGGERRRLQMVALLAQQPNFLILDEPSNDLDTATLSLLEEFLLDFPGCLVVASHDRWFMDRLTDLLFIVSGDGEIRKFPGNFSEYLEYRRMQAAEAKSAASTSAGRGSSNTASVRGDTPSGAGAEAGGGRTYKKLGYKEVRTLKELGTELPRLEKRRAELQSLLSGGESDYKQLEAWSTELTSLESDLARKEEIWLELSERHEAAQ